MLYAGHDPGGNQWVSGVARSRIRAGSPSSIRTAPSTRGRPARPGEPARARAAGPRPAARRRLAALLPNGVAPFEVYLAALQAGWYYPDQLALHRARRSPTSCADCEAKAFFVHERFAAVGRGRRRRGRAAGRAPRFGYGDVPGFRRSASCGAGQPATLPGDRTAGAAMHYTSGTTGRPKGVRRPLTGLDPDDAGRALTVLLAALRHHRRRGQRAPGDLAELPHRGHRRSAATRCTWGTRSSAWTSGTPRRRCA